MWRVASLTTYLIIATTVWLGTAQVSHAQSVILTLDEISVSYPDATSLGRRVRMERSDAKYQAPLVTKLPGELARRALGELS